MRVVRRTLTLCGAAIAVGLLMTAQYSAIAEESATEAHHWTVSEADGPPNRQSVTKDKSREIFKYGKSLQMANPSLSSSGMLSESSHVQTGARRCDVLPGGYKSWRQGTVTSLSPSLPVNCSRVFAGDDKETERAKRVVSTWRNALSDQDAEEMVQNCSWLAEHFTNNLYITEEELSFPLAFSLVVYDSPQQVLRLLRVLYRPHNAYCIHHDAKSRFKKFFEHIALCFDNVMIASRTENVVWGYYTILQAQMNCLADLLEYRCTQELKWKYVINLCGKELPLATTREMVSRLVKLDGSSSIITQPCAKRRQIQQRLVYPAKLNEEGNGVVLDKQVKLKPPFDLRYYHKSSSYNALSREFVEYILLNTTARKLYEFFKKTKNAEEHFYATLYHLPGVPGGYSKRLRHLYFEVAGSYWSKVNTFQRDRKYACQGTVVHFVCVVGVGDLPALLTDSMTTQHLFHNKYFMEHDHIVMDCMEQLIVRRNWAEFQQECGG